jgi:KaiC/GvpD/RAD55 family RecA-like ATPase
VLAGPTGAGKTTAILQFVLEGVRRAEPCQCANFEENPMQLARCLRSLGADVEARSGAAYTYSTLRRWSSKSTASRTKGSAFSERSPSPISYKGVSWPLRRAPFAGRAR